MKLTIEKFSYMFCFGHSVSSSTNEEDLCCDIREYKDLEYNEIFDNIQLYGVKYSKQFMEAVVKIFMTAIKNDFASKEKFMCFVLSRCMILSETPTLFSFILVCIFVNTVISGVFLPLELECFTVAQTASKCLTAAFYRRYVDLFDKENGFEGLASYCEKLNETLLHCSDEDSETENERSSVNPVGFTPPNTEELIDLLCRLKEVDDADFLLTEYEKKLLYDQDSLPLDIDPSEDNFIQSDDGSGSSEIKSLDRSSKNQDSLPLDIEPGKDIFTQLDDGSKLSEIEKLDVAVQNLNIKSKHILERFNNLCMLCKDNCYKHVVFAAKNLEVGVI